MFKSTVVQNSTVYILYAQLLTTVRIAAANSDTVQRGRGLQMALEAADENSTLTANEKVVAGWVRASLTFRVLTAGPVASASKSPRKSWTVRILLAVFDHTSDQLERTFGGVRRIVSADIIDFYRGSHVRVVGTVVALVALLNLTTLFVGSETLSGRIGIWSCVLGIAILIVWLNVTVDDLREGYVGRMLLVAVTPPGETSERGEPPTEDDE